MLFYLLGDVNILWVYQPCVVISAIEFQALEALADILSI